MASKGTKKTCPRGHVFYKSSDCPVCPTCWKGYYKKDAPQEFPAIGAPALRALLNAKIPTLKALSRHRKEEILALHGMGPRAVAILSRALVKKRLSFRKA